MERKLASIQRIKAIHPALNADALEIADVLGWHVVIRKGEFKEGDLVVYCEIDSVMPKRKEFEFLKPRNYIISTAKLRGNLSQGICFPLSILPQNTVTWSVSLLSTKNKEYKEGDDVTSLLGITKRIESIPQQEGAIGHLPIFLRETFEARIQSLSSSFIERQKGKMFFITEKLDGMSGSYWINEGKFGVGSRDVEYAETKNNIFWEIAKKYSIENKLRNTKRNICIQGEIVGPGIKGNKYRLTEHTIFFFNTYDIDNQKYLNYQYFEEVICSSELDMVPIVNLELVFNYTIDELIELSKGKSLITPIEREGLVFRTLIEDTDLETGRLSFKVVNPEFLLKNKE